MKNLDMKSVMKPTLILFAICLIVAAALAGTNALTADRIAQAAEQAEIEARSQVLKGIFYELVSDGDVTVYAVMSDRDLPVSASDVSDTDVSDTDATPTDLHVIGYVATASSKGYGGDVDVMVGVGVDGRITGVTVLDNSETAGLGANCTKEDWLAQFAGMSGTLKVKKDGGDVDALTSATITSRAVCAAINKATQAVSIIAAEGGNVQ